MNSHIPFFQHAGIVTRSIAWFVLVVLFLISLPVVLVWPGSFFAGLMVLSLLLALPVLGGVVLKMLPFDNKSEFQVVLNTPEGTTLEQTTRIAREMAEAIRTLPEVRDFQIYAGTAAPFNFNGLVRHSYLRRGPNVADIQVNLVGKEARSDQSHAIAKRVRPLVAAVAKKYGAAVAVSEVPPGPPVLQSIVAEIYGPDETQRLALAREVRGIMEQTPGVVDIDWYVEDEQPKVRFVVDRAKAAQHGVSEAAIARTLGLAAQGAAVDLLHAVDEREDVLIILITLNWKNHCDLFTFDQWEDVHDWFAA